MISYEELLSLFISNPEDAIEKSQDLICSVTDFNSYSEFYKFHLEHPHNSTCQREWTTPQMSIHCYDCENTPQSCACLQCFLKGNHKGHDYTISPNSRGNCDCGDVSNWKQSGFCSDHHGVEENSHPESYLEQELRTVLTDIIFKAAFKALPSLNTDEDSKYEKIIQFISSFLRFGDGFRRLVTIAFTEKVGTKTIFDSIFEGSEKYNQQLEKLSGCLVNDDLFRCSISPVVFDLMLEKIIPDSFDFQTDETNYKAWNIFWFHFFSKKTIEYSITEYKWDCISFTLKFSNLMKKNFALIGQVPLTFDLHHTTSEILTGIPRAFNVQTAEQIQFLFDQLVTNVLNSGSCEGQKDNIVVASFSDQHKESYYRPIDLFKIYYFMLVDCFKHKKDLKLDKLFEELDKETDISPIFCIGRNEVGGTNDNENDKFVSKFLKSTDDESFDINDDYFKSFHNGGSFFYCFPLYELLLHILKTDNLNRVRVARMLSMGKYQSLRVKLGIIALKNILSFTCLHQSLTSKENKSLQIFMKNLLRTVCLSSAVPLYLPLFQLILGLQCNEENVTDEFSLKEFFAFEMAREIGLFDDFESYEYSDEEIGPLQKQMFFFVLYIAILIVIERNIFNFNPFNFIEEQVILALKGGISQLNELSKSYDNCMESHSKKIFNDIISKVATTNRTSEKNDNNDTKESSFFLKKDVKWKTITALNQFNTQKVILEKEISKNPTKLLQIPDFEPEERFFFHPPAGYNANANEDSIDEYDIDSTGLNINLKEFLFTPTILAVCYHTLRSSSEEGNQKATLNDHLAMMILVLVNQFASEIESQNPPPFDYSTVVQYDSSLNDLISNLKKTVFGLNIEDGSATIKNTLDRKSFHTFLNVKIGSPDHSPKSFIDLLLEKGEIGKNVLTQMSVDISKYGFNDANTDIEQVQIKKERAKKLKAEIMSQFKSMASDYNFTDLDQLDESRSLSTTIGDVCSICSTAKENEILSYAVYIYRTKIPFAFDKPPMVLYNPQCEVPVDDDINDLFFNEDELQQMANENENDDNDNDEDEGPDIEDMMRNLNTEGDMTIELLLLQLLIKSRQKKRKHSEEKVVKKQYMQKLNEYKEELLKSEAYERGISDTERMVTSSSS